MEPEVDPTAILEEAVLPIGFGEHNLDRIPIPTTPKGESISLLDALVNMADAGIRMDFEFNLAAKAQLAERELQDFIEAGKVQGIATIPQSAIKEKERQIADSQKAETREAQRSFAMCSAIAAKLLHQARAAAQLVPSHVQAEPPANRLTAHMVDLLETHLVEELFETKTNEELIEIYEHSKDTDNRSFVRAIEGGRRSRKLEESNKETQLSMRLSKLILARRAARIPPELRKHFDDFRSVSKSNHRGAKDILMSQGVGTR